MDGHGRPATPGCAPTTSSGDLDAGDPQRLHLADQHRRLPVEHRRRARHRADRPQRGPRPDAARRSTPSATLEQHEPSRHVLQLVRPGRPAPSSPTWPESTGGTIRSTRSCPASTTAGWPPALHGRRARRAAAGRRRPTRSASRWTSASTTTRRRELPAAPARSAAASGTTQPAGLLRSPATTAAGHRRLLHLPPLRRLQHRAADRVVPRHRRRPDPGQALLRHRAAPSRRQLRLVAGPRPEPVGCVARATSASTSSRAPTTTAACSIVPTWGGDMFEALMVPLFVPEETWGKRSRGAVNHPLYVRGADRARPGRRRATATGASRRRTTRPAATASTASTRSAWQPDGYTSDQERTSVDQAYERLPRRGAARPRRRTATASSPRTRPSSPAATRRTPRWPTCAKLRGELRRLRPRRLLRLRRRRQRPGRQALPLARPGHDHGRARQRARRRRHARATSPRARCSTSSSR